MKLLTQIYLLRRRQNQYSTNIANQVQKLYGIARPENKVFMHQISANGKNARSTNKPINSKAMITRARP